jgi:hypothetical protein
MGVAGTWVAGALSSGPLHLGSIQGRENAKHRPVVTPVLTGIGAFGLFYGAARLARHIPLLDRAIGGVLRYVDEGSTRLVLLTACTNGVAEEMFFRGALWPVVEESHPVVKTTLAYAAMTAATRNPALVLGGTVMSVLFGLQRRASGGILAPVLTHVTWSVLMLCYLPPLFRTPQRPKAAHNRSWVWARRLSAKRRQSRARPRKMPARSSTKARKPRMPRSIDQASRFHFAR